MKPIKEILETVDNYVDDYYVYADSFKEDANAFVAQGLGYTGQQMENEHPGYIEIASLQIIMDSRTAWHEEIEEFDPAWISEFLSERKKFANLDPTKLNCNARPIGTGTIKKLFSIKPKNAAFAKTIGKGNASAGVDEAIEFYAKHHGLA